MFLSKGFMVIVMILVGAVIAIIRLVKNEQSRHSAGKIIKNIQQNPEKAEKYASKLDCFLGRYEDDNPKILSDLIKELESRKQIGKYFIHGIYPLLNGKYLIVTQCNDKEYAMNPGGMEMVNEVYQINFLVSYKQQLNQLVIHSHLYANRAEERLLKEFPKEAFSLLDEKNRSLHHPNIAHTVSPIHRR